MCLEAKELTNFRLSITDRSQAVRGEVAKEFAASTKIYQAEAAAIGIPWAKIHYSVIMSDECKKLQVVKTEFKDLADVMELFWRGLSGQAHSFGYAAQAGTTVERSSVIPGGQEQMVTINEGAFTAHAMGVAILLTRAIQLYSRRSEVSVQPPD